ncbi:hypothetical protein QR680_013658 [Steinernema hermaphroditum]|uniref:Uncharacterized protein n=1 Tax=Steinernema hermaphroditum TaxID=289476 RepID=A0AA39I8B4_9BILA|nr:hypothetical protein QR680_013658 [Steinernema hermaphroditum]
MSAVSAPREIQLAEGFMFSYASIQALLRHLKERKLIRQCVYPAMPFVVVCVSQDAKSFAAMRFSLRYGIEDMYHAHGLDDYNWMEQFAGLKRFIGDLEADGVYSMGYDMETVQNLMIASFKGVMEEEVIKKRIFSLEELEMAVLKNIAPQFTDRWGDRDCELYIESGYATSFQQWQDHRRRCCWNILVSSNIFNNHCPGVHLFGLMFDTFPPNLLSGIARQATFLKTLERECSD